MIYVAWIVPSVVVYLLVGVVVVSLIDRSLDPEDKFDPEERFDRGLFRSAVTLWPVTLLGFGAYLTIEHTHKRLKGSHLTQQIGEFFHQGGISGAYLKWRERR